MAKKNRYHKKKLNSEDPSAKDPTKLNYWRLMLKGLNIASTIYSRAGKNWAALNELIGRNHNYLQQTLTDGDMPLSTAQCIAYNTEANPLAIAIDMLPEEKQETTLSKALKADMEMMTQAYEKLEKESAAKDDTIVRLNEKVAERDRIIEMLSRR